MPDQPGRLVLFGSGETAASGRKVFDQLFQTLPAPAKIAILETPAGFEPNTEAVAGKLAEFLQRGLQNYPTDISIVPARKRGTSFSPDDPALVDPVLTADCILLGPGSPTYAVRQLRSSVLWDAIRLRFSAGAALVLASASVLAISACTLPVYEIYKAGADLSWENGLDLLGPAGLRFAFVPHWNNREGGSDLDTSRCYMGEERFAQLRTLLPVDVSVLGIDEHTALIIEPATSSGRIVGQGGVTLESGAESKTFSREDVFELGELDATDWEAVASDVGANLRRRATELNLERQSGRSSREPMPPEVQELVERREDARARKDWATADALRDELEEQGYSVQDTPNGPDLSRIS